jgi:hypothetical protein
MKKVECWRWRYRDIQLGCIRRTTVGLTEQEAAAYPEAERIDGTLSLRETEDDLLEQVDDGPIHRADGSELISSRRGSNGSAGELESKRRTIGATAGHHRAGGWNATRA